MYSITLTRHAETVLEERKIKRAWLEETVRNPALTEPDPLHPDAVRAFRPISENGGRVLRVVYVLDGDVMRVITAFFDRSRRK